MPKKDYYQILEVSRDASEADIRKAYRRLARAHHPDLNKQAGAEERFKQIGEAYEVLGDAEKRAAYDKYGDMWKHAEELDKQAERQAAYGGFGSPFGSYQTYQGGAPPDLGEIFGDFFGSFNGRRGGPGRSQAGFGFRMAGEDQHAEVEITLEEAFKGGSRGLLLERVEEGRHGGKPREIKVKIPAGVTDGQSLRLEGQGSAGMGGGPAGDLYLKIKIAPHDRFELKGKDVILPIPVAPWEAALGATIEVPVLGGSAKVKIPPGSQGGARLRLKGKGLPGKKPGDQFVVLKIVTPKAQTDEQRELYRKMAESFPFDPREGL